MWLDTSISIMGNPIFAYIEGGLLRALDISRNQSPHYPDPGEARVLEQLSWQLGQYIGGTRQGFDLPVEIPQTPWRRSVFNALASVPYGKTVSYAQLAHMAGNPRAARAVASALSSNPLPLLRACHRVVPGAATGHGQYCWGSPTKQLLLEMEARNA